jgi:hypothetical protein
MTIQNTINELLKAGKTQSEIASISGLSQGRISQLLKSGSCRYEAGVRLSNWLAEMQKQNPPSTSR